MKCSVLLLLCVFGAQLLLHAVAFVFNEMEESLIRDTDRKSGCQCGSDTETCMCHGITCYGNYSFAMFVFSLLVFCPRLPCAWLLRSFTVTGPVAVLKILICGTTLAVIYTEYQVCLSFFFFCSCLCFILVVFTLLSLSLLLFLLRTLADNSLADVSSIHLDLLPSLTKLFASFWRLDWWSFFILFFSEIWVLIW